MSVLSRIFMIVRCCLRLEDSLTPSRVIRITLFLTNAKQDGFFLGFVCLASPRRSPDLPDALPSLSVSCVLSTHLVLSRSLSPSHARSFSAIGTLSWVRIDRDALFRRLCTPPLPPPPGATVSTEEHRPPPLPFLSCMLALNYEICDMVQFHETPTIFSLPSKYSLVLQSRARFSKVPSSTNVFAFDVSTFLVKS